MKILINSFPKSGTHLAMQMAEALAQRREPTPWMDCFDLGGWGTRFEDLDATVRQIRSQPDGTWMVGHVGYRPEIAEALRKAGTAVLFVHRDLRDVAVSQVRHIEDPDEERFRHPGKILYMSLGSFEERLRAVIEGLDHYLGIFERWALFAPWLEQGWILPLRYEEMIDEPDATARRFMNYVINHSGSISADGGLVERVRTRRAGSFARAAGARRSNVPRGESQQLAGGLLAGNGAAVRGPRIGSMGGR